MPRLFHPPAPPQEVGPPTSASILGRRSRSAPSARRALRTGGVLVAAALAVSGLAFPEEAHADPADFFAAVATTGSELAPTLTEMTFADPPASVRPKYRWWMPLAYTDDDQLLAELDQMKAIGAGGAEVSVDRAEGPDAKTQEFLSTYGWGTPLWTQKVQTMLEGAEERGLGLDFTSGPRWPAVVPTVSDINDPRVAQQLIFSHEFHAGGSVRSGALPTNYNTAPPTGARTTLVNVVVARCEESTCATQSEPPRLLDEDSVIEVTAQVSDSGELDYTFPGTADETYALIAFYQTATAENREYFTATGKNYYLDHLSRQGLQATTDFFEEHILTPQVTELIESVGRVDLFEDSLELGDAQKWTWDFAEEWEQRRGYSPATLMPALAGIGPQGKTARAFFDFGNGVGERVRTDYRQTWSDLYIQNRLEPLDTWADKRGMRTRVQPYGHPVDIVEAATKVDIPEGESLAFAHNVEDYKVIASGAHMSGSSVVSNECCAAREAVWGTTASGLGDAANLPAVYKSFAGGVNQVVWHGLPYLSRGPIGSATQSKWPGMTYGGNTSFAEAWGAKGGPNWEDYRAINDHLGRLQLVLRQGQPRFDIGVYWHDFGMSGHGTTGTSDDTLLKTSSPLAASGYSYEYVSPAHLRSDDAVFRDGLLFPKQSGYRAFLLNEPETMPIDVAQTLRDRAAQGLPIVMIGDGPQRTPGYDPTGDQDEQLRDLVAELSGMDSVISVDDVTDVPAALEELNVRASAAPAVSSADVLHVRRAVEGANYYFLYNQTGAATEKTLHLRGEGTPYRLNTWTGTVVPIEDYTVGNGTTAVEVQLEANESDVIAIINNEGSSLDQPVAPRSGEPLGREQIDDWTLQVESWTAGPSGAPGDTAKTPLEAVELHADPDGRLPAWSAIAPQNGYAVDLRDVSGIGTYTTTLSLDDGWDGVSGAYLDLGRVVDTVRVTVNDQELPPVDPADVAHIEVGQHLHAGDNTIEVRVASTLINAVRVTPHAGAEGRERMDYGMFGPVTVTPYEADRPTLMVESLDDDLPLAHGARNWVRLRITNGDDERVEVELEARLPAGVEGDLPAGAVALDPGESKTVRVRLRNTAASAATALATVTAQASNGASGQASVNLVHYANLAVNTVGAPFPKVEVSSLQNRYAAEHLIDGDTSTFWVSHGRAPGQGPTPAKPATITTDLGGPAAIDTVTLFGRSDWGPRNYEVQISTDGSDWETVATVVDAPKTSVTSTFPSAWARYVRIVITESWSPNLPASNTQASEIAIFAATVPPEDEEPTEEPTTPGEEPTDEPTEEPTTPGEEPTDEPTTPDEEPTTPGGEQTDEPTTPGEEPTSPDDGGVGAADPDAASDHDGDADDGSGASGEPIDGLPSTGVDGIGTAAVAALMLLLGSGAAVLAARRYRQVRAGVSSS